MPQVAAAQEVVLTISGGLADAETGGVVVNVIPREGANNFNGQFNVSGSNSSLQGSNYTERLKAKGLRSPSELISVYDVNPMFGGRLVRNKLWFFSAFRQTGGESTVPGLWSGLQCAATKSFSLRSFASRSRACSRPPSPGSAFMAFLASRQNCSSVYAMMVLPIRRKRSIAGKARSMRQVCSLPGQKPPVVPSLLRFGGRPWSFFSVFHIIDTLTL